jgi:hypothetical protein
LTAHLTDEEIRKYCEQSLTAQRLVAADLHLSECDGCAKRLQELSTASIQKAVRNLHQDLQDTAREDDHISYEEMEAYADGKLDDVQLEIVRSHLEVCSQCKTESQDLGSFRNSFISETGQASGRVIPWRRSVAGAILRIAGAAAAIAIVVWAATLPMRDRIKGLEAQLKEANKENAQLAMKNSELQTEIAKLKPSQTPLIASLKDSGSVVGIDQKGHITGITSSSPQFLKITKDALTNQNVEVPEILSGLIGKQGTLLGEPREGRPFVLTAPVGTVVVEDRPTFRWKPLQDATGYRVRVYDRNFKEVAASELLQNTKWTSSNSLQRGKTYNWIVTADVSGKEISSPVPPAPEARFKVLDSVQFKNLQQSKQEFTQSHLLSGLVYAQLGLLDNSIQEFQQLVAENPDSPIAKKLLDQVQSLRKK